MHITISWQLLFLVSFSFKKFQIFYLLSFLCSYPNVASNFPPGVYISRVYLFPLGTLIYSILTKSPLEPSSLFQYELAVL